MNDAYRVLRDPTRRVAYDRSLVTVSRPTTPSPAPTPAADPTPVAVAPAARFPWRGMVVATTIAVLAAGGASLLSRPAEPPTPDGMLDPGSCVSIEPNGDARETTCTGVGDVVVQVVVPVGVACPFGTEPHRDHQGQGTACLTGS